MREKHTVVYCEGNLDGTVGGSYFSLLFLVSALDRQKFRPIVVFRRDHALMGKFRAEGVDVVVIPQPKPVDLGMTRDRGRQPPWLLPLFTTRRAINFLKVYVWDGIKIAWWLRGQRADLVHLNNSVTRNHSWMLAARLLNIPCVSHERGMNEGYSAISLFFAPRLSRVICISQAVRDNLVERQVSKDNLTVIHNGIDADKYRPERCVREIKRELGIPETVPVIGMVGNIRRWKGQDVLVRALGRLRSRYPDLICVFVGEATSADQPFMDYLRKLAADLSVTGNLIFVGYQRDVASYINTLDLVVHASVNPEPFGRVLIEAMALGKPVIGARAGAVPEILNEPECGLTFEPGDDKGLAHAIDTVISNPSLAKNVGEAGASRVRVQFGIEQNVRATENVYLEILEKSNSRR